MVRKWSVPLLWLVIFLLLTGTSPAAGDRVTIRYAKGFTVKYQGNLTLITVKNPWPGAETVFQYLLKPRGTATPRGFGDYQVVETPVNRLVSLSTTHLAFLDSLEQVDKLVGFSSPDRVYTPSVRRAIDKGLVKGVGRGSNLQVETVLELEPDLILTYGTGSFRDAHPKLIEAGLKVAIDAEYMENHPLGRAEWIKFVALFFNKEKKAEELFSAMETRYLKLAAQAASVRKRPTVLTNTPFSGRWHVAQGDSFVARFLRDAGADYIWKDVPGTGSLPMDIEMVYDRGRYCRYWINTGIWTTLAQAVRSAPRMADFVSIGQGNLYNNNKRVGENGANDFWESGMMQPDVILADLIRIFHPELLPEHQLYYYRQLQ